MSYKVLFDRIPDEAGSLYESGGEKSFYISEHGTTIVEHDHEKEGTRVFVPMFELFGENPYCVLYTLFTMFESLDKRRNGEDHTIICAHRDFEISGLPNNERMFSMTPAIISIDVEDIDLDIYHEFIPVRTGFNKTDTINFSFNEENITELGRIVEVYKVIHS